jgi:hypothetical protein
MYKIIFSRKQVFHPIFLMTCPWETHTYVTIKPTTEKVLQMKRCKKETPGHMGMQLLLVLQGTLYLVYICVKEPKQQKQHCFAAYLLMTNENHIISDILHFLAKKQDSYATANKQL